MIPLLLVLALAVPTPEPSPSTPPVVGARLSANDPCTSISAIVSRPTTGNSVCTVRPGHVLFETGYQNLSASGVGNTISVPQTLIRIGTSFHAVEIDIVPPSYQHLPGNGATAFGATDTALGLKSVIGTTPRFAYGVQAQTSVPTGTGPITAKGANLFGALNVSYVLSPFFSLGGSLAEQSTTNGSQRWGQIIPALSVSTSLPESCSLFAEVAAFSSATGPGTSTRVQYILGASHALTKRLQIDLEGGFSPTVSAGKYSFIGFGAAYYL
jgi:hypothetical protein